MANFEGIPVFPAGLKQHGGDVIAINGQVHRADATITLLDAWTFDPREMGNQRWIPYYPVDSEPIPPGVFQKINLAFDRIAMSKFGERMTNNAGLSCHYVPHAVNTKVFRPLDQNTAREFMSGRFKDVAKFPQDKFIVGMVAANIGYPDRKCFEPQIQGFAKFHEKHHDSMLYMHTWGDDPRGVNVIKMAEYHGLVVNRDIVFADPGGLHYGYPNDYLANMYSSLDVFLLASSGEGFGVPLIEAQACGVPVITGAWTATEELCLSGWKIDKKDAYPMWIDQQCYMYRVNADAVTDALEKAYMMKGNQDYRSRARDGALGYDIDKVVEKYWLPALAKIQERIEASK